MASTIGLQNITGSLMTLIINRNILSPSHKILPIGAAYCLIGILAISLGDILTIFNH